MSDVTCMVALADAVVLHLIVALGVVFTKTSAERD